ncbi:MAG: HIT family protein [Clostridia bacterium]|jgi:diadenosine tetraphosphate (Ap4A) HIT family hydrolase|nr:HIT family protein [Clostridia bacterium]
MKKDDCIFCKLDNYVLENDLAYAIFDINPVSLGHMLIILKDHKENIFDTNDADRLAMLDLLNQGKALIDSKHNPQGYNVCLNCGVTAGQTVMHVHMHLIPRYDNEDSTKVKNMVPSA